MPRRPPQKPAGNLAELRARADHLRAQWEKLEQEKSLRQQRRAEAQRLVELGVCMKLSKMYQRSKP